MAFNLYNHVNHGCLYFSTQKSEDFNLKCTVYSYLFHACSGVIVQEIVIFIVNISITKHLFLMIRVNTNIANK